MGTQRVNELCHHGSQIAHAGLENNAPPVDRPGAATRRPRPKPACARNGYPQRPRGIWGAQKLFRAEERRGGGEDEETERRDPRKNIEAATGGYRDKSPPQNMAWVPLRETLL